MDRTFASGPEQFVRGTYGHMSRLSVGEGRVGGMGRWQALFPSGLSTGYRQQAAAPDIRRIQPSGEGALVILAGSQLSKYICIEATIGSTSVTVSVPFPSRIFTRRAA